MGRATDAQRKDDMDSNVRARSHTDFSFWPALDGVKRIFVLSSGAGALQQPAGSMHTCDPRFGSASRYVIGLRLYSLINPRPEI